MKKIIKLNKRDLIRIVEDTMKFMNNPDILPKLVSDLEKVVNDGKKSLYNIHSTVVNITILDIYENMDNYIQTIKKFKNYQNFFQSKWEKYYDILESFYVDHLNDNLDDKMDRLYTIGDKLNTELDEIQTDMNNLINILEDLIDICEKEIINGFDKRYPDRIININ